MHKLKYWLWALLGGTTLLWLIVDPAIFSARGLFPVRGLMVQYSGILAMVCMSVAMILALRPVWLEDRFDGLDKMYRFHKWLGIAALVLAIVHWLWAKGPKWAVGWGRITRPARHSRGEPGNPVEAMLGTLRGTRGLWRSDRARLCGARFPGQPPVPSGNVRDALMVNKKPPRQDGSRRGGLLQSGAASSECALLQDERAGTLSLSPSLARRVGWIARPLV